MSINDQDQTKVEPVEVKQPEEILSPPVDIGLNAVRDILEIEPKEQGKYGDKLDILLTWAKGQTDDHSPENLKWVIRELGYKLGSPPLGQKLVNWLAEFAYLDNESKKLNKRLDQFKHGHH